MTLRRRLTDFVGRVVDGSPTLQPRRAEALALIDAMTEGWGDRSPDAAPYASYLARDGTPFEPSVRISDRPSELRWVLEPQPDSSTPTAADYLRASLALNERLAVRGLADLGPARTIEDIFIRRPSERHLAALWFGASLDAVGPPVVKNYFVVSDPAQAREAFARFGLAGLGDALDRARPADSRVEFVSVDLVRADPRLKLYVRHRSCDPDAIDRLHAGSPTWRRGDAAMLLNGLFGAIPETRKIGPISTFHVSLAERAVTHSAVNVNLEPLHYASRIPGDDAVMAERIARLVASLGLRLDPLYPHMLEIARRDGVAYPHHRYCGLQRRGDRVEVTVYLSTLLQALRHGVRIGPVHIPAERFVRR